MYNRHFIRNFTAIVLSFLITSCETGSSTRRMDRIVLKEDLKTNLPIDNTAKIGFMVPLSGPSKDVGNALLNSAMLAISENNNANISLEVIDSSSSAFDASAAVSQLKKERAEFILGPLFFAEAKEVAAFAKKESITVISFSNNSSLASSEALIMGITPQSVAKRIVDFATVHENIKEFYALLPDNKYGRIFETVIASNIDTIPGAGFSASFYNSDDSMRKSFTELTELMNNKSGEKALIFPEGGENLAKFSLFLKDLPSDSRSFKLFGSDNWDDDKALANINLDNAFYIKLRSNNYQNFSKRFQKAFGYKPPHIAIIAYDAVILASNLERQKLEFSLAEIVKHDRYQGEAMDFKFSNDGIVMYDLPLAKIEN